MPTLFAGHCCKINVGFTPFFVVVVVLVLGFSLARTEVLGRSSSCLFSLSSQWRPRVADLGVLVGFWSRKSTQERDLHTMEPLVRGVTCSARSQFVCRSAGP